MTGPETVTAAANQLLGQGEVACSFCKVRWLTDFLMGGVVAGIVGSFCGG